MNDCSNHKKELFGETDMKKVAEAIGDLHYETLKDLLYNLSEKIDLDATKDYIDGKEKSAAALQYLAMSLFESALRAQKVWKISKPFMTNDKKQ